MGWRRRLGTHSVFSRSLASKLSSVQWRTFDGAAEPTRGEELPAAQDSSSPCRRWTPRACIAPCSTTPRSYRRLWARSSTRRPSFIGGPSALPLRWKRPLPRRPGARAGPCAGRLWLPPAAAGRRLQRGVAEAFRPRARPRPLGPREKIGAKWPRLPSRVAAFSPSLRPLMRRRQCGAPPPPPAARPACSRPGRHPRDGVRAVVSGGA